MKMSAAGLCGALLLLASAFPASASYNRYGVPDSSEIRRDLVETWFEAPLSAVRMNPPEIRENGIGQQFQVRLEEMEDSFAILVAPYAKIAVDVYSDEGVETIQSDVFPGDAPGSWVLVRDKKTGRPLCIRCFFASDGEIFAQFLPDGRTSSADFLIYNCYAARGVPTGLPFRRFYTASFDEVIQWTERTLPWQYADIYGDDYHAAQQMAAVIRENLPRILITDDAMYDEDGAPVFVSDGLPRTIADGDAEKISVSGAGFLKWIADGIIEPLTGGRLKRLPLLVQTVRYKDVGFQGSLSERYEISFALNWIRNLASAIMSVRTGADYLYNESGVDVRIEPFAAELTAGGIANSAGFMENAGYSVQVLKALLYVLAVEEPDTFYFAAIRETDSRRIPEVKAFNECAVFFPYFTADRRFACAVFMNGAELSFDEFFARYCRDFVFLTRARCTEQFFPE
ncbi:MAG: hypothetical protein K2H09_09770 [Treponemataceae bacterium]|nr:hypothetical protein [Treponemataceae bacterium]